MFNYKTHTVQTTGHISVLYQDETGNNLRRCFAPGADVTAEPPEVQAEAVTAWTPEVIAAYQARMAELEPTAEELEAAAVSNAKTAKQAALDSIVVTTSLGNTFDGHETARNNMVSAILSAETAGQNSTPWKLADNTVVVVGLPELKEALMLAIQAVGVIVVAIQQ